MKFTLEQQETTQLTEKYNTKKSFIKRIERRLNKIEIIDNKNDYLYLVEAVLSTYTIINNQVKYFSKDKDKLLIGISLDYIIEYELKRKYSISIETNKNLLHENTVVKKLKR